MIDKIKELIEEAEAFDRVKGRHRFEKKAGEELKDPNKFPNQF